MAFNSFSFKVFSASFVVVILIYAPVTSSALAVVIKNVSAPNIPDIAQIPARMDNAIIFFVLFSWFTSIFLILYYLNLMMIYFQNQLIVAYFHRN